MITKTTLIWLAVGAGALLGLMCAPAQARNDDRQYEVQIHRTTPDGQTHDATTYICMGPKQFAKPAKRLTGPRCQGQAFTLTDDALSWTAACDAAKGQGQWRFSHGGKTFEGQSVIDTPQGRTTTKVEGDAFGSCDL
ncbi:MAG TPA: DUF3617 family protein [Asticcacaulis sp.]|jgi:hypothetical protein|nr:DUF3617 family protein [Asticcacaulis sp.]